MFTVNPVWSYTSFIVLSSTCAMYVFSPIISMRSRLPSSNVSGCSG